MKAQGGTKKSHREFDDRISRFARDVADILKKRRPRTPEQRQPITRCMGSESNVLILCYSVASPSLLDHVNEQHKKSL